MRVHSINFLMRRTFEKSHGSTLHMEGLVQKLCVDGLAVWGCKGVLLEVSRTENVVTCNQKHRQSCGLFHFVKEALGKALNGVKLAFIPCIHREGGLQ